MQLKPDCSLAILGIFSSSFLFSPRYSDLSVYCYYFFFPLPLFIFFSFFFFGYPAAYRSS